MNLIISQRKPKTLSIFWRFCQMLKQGKLIRWLDFKSSPSPACMVGARKKTILSDAFAKLWFRLLVRMGKPF
nr:MAG TPA: hypothetical protein [Caudoviricetes sp.]